MLSCRVILLGVFSHPWQIKFCCFSTATEGVLQSHSTNFPCPFCGSHPSIPPWLTWLNSWNPQFCFWLLLSGFAAWRTFILGQCYLKQSQAPASLSCPLHWSQHFSMVYISARLVSWSSSLHAHINSCTSKNKAQRSSQRQWLFTPV